MYTKGKHYFLKNFVCDRLPKMHIEAFVNVGGINNNNGKIQIAQTIQIVHLRGAFELEVQ